MTAKEPIVTDKFSELRARAEQQLEKGEGAGAVTISPAELLQTVHELHTHQIELELQNEDLRLALGELELSLKKFRDLYDFAPVGYLTISDKGLLIEINLTAATILGVERNKLLNQPLSSYIHKDDRDSYYHCHQKLMQTKKQQQCEVRMYGKDGQLFHAQLQSSVHPQLDGSRGKFRSVLTDVSERHAFEEKLLLGKKQWESTFDAMTEIVTIQDREFHIVRANKAAYHTFNAELGELVGKKCYEVFRGADEACEDCPLVEENNQDLQRSGKIYHEPLGKTFLVSSSRIMNDNHEVQYLIHTAMDVSELERLEKLLRQKYKMEAVGLLAGGIAHNFNNNLSIILGNLELSKMRLTPESEVIPFLDNALIGVNRSRSLVQKILNYSSQGTGNHAPMKVALVFEETMKLLRSTFPVTVVFQKKVSPEASVAIIKADSSQIQEVLINLCNNAIYAMAEEGVLTVSLETIELKANDALLNNNENNPGSYVKISVEDTGCGMSTELIDKIFDPFFTTKGVGVGSGMGLSTVQGIVNQYGGLMTVQSLPGQGSIFDIYFPRIETTHQDRARIAQSYSKGTENILLVDDDPLIAGLNEQLLAEMGYQVTVKIDSREALELVAANPDRFDLLITDQTMPDLTGQKLIEKIKEHRPDMPTILCTGHSSKINANQAQRQGIDAFLLKPMELTGLLKTVRQILDKSKKRWLE
ncbi:response regulator [uncultured Desulfuromusa sp.]|uniref:PAS domain-containing hybrid sensor histidine kinase/response regulator n=1 Tax=uncultured Desulfuromusa sp. TaxID=219183 RepID=UPI002AA84C97|nr:response regulator [uncultured Desulfuromusa sp.]